MSAIGRIVHLLLRRPLGKNGPGQPPFPLVCTWASVAGSVDASGSSLRIASLLPAHNHSLGGSPACITQAAN
jgi:hypothetical protein